MRLLEALLALVVVVGALLSRRPVSRLPPGVDAADLAAGYERSDARTGWIVVGGIVLLVALGGVVLAATAFEAYVTGIPPTVGPPPDLVHRLTPAPTPPAPRLETAEGQDLTAYRADAEQRLNSYGWVDRQAGVVRIPIDRAMTILAQQGLPARQSPSTATPATPATLASDDGAHQPSTASSGRVEESDLP